jgi:hypothetical protein
MTTFESRFEDGSCIPSSFFQNSSTFGNDRMWILEPFYATISHFSGMRQFCMHCRYFATQRRWHRDRPHHRPHLDALRHGPDLDWQHLHRHSQHLHLRPSQCAHRHGYICRPKRLALAQYPRAANDCGLGRFTVRRLTVLRFPIHQFGVFGRVLSGQAIQTIAWYVYFTDGFAY